MKPLAKTAGRVERGVAALAVGLAAALLPVPSARSEPFAYQHRVEVGRPPKPLLVQIKQEDARTVLVAEQRRADLPIQGPQRADVQAVAIANGAVVAVVRVTAADGRQAAAIVARRGAVPEILWTGALDLRGDPGEREGFVLDLQDPNGDGVVDVVLSRVAERVRLCGQSRTLLDSKTVDPASMRLAPWAADRLGPAPANGIELVATADGARNEAPPVSALRLDSVSSLPGGEQSRAPTTLTDGNPATFWTEAGGRGGRGEFATFRWEGAGFAIQALALVPRPSGLAADHPASLPRTLWLVTEGAPRLRIRLPDQPEAGRRYLVKLPAPLATRCLSLVVDEAAAPPGGKPGPVVLAEVEAYSELDLGGGVERLVHELASGGKRAGSAEQLLSGLGARAVAALGQAWPTLSPGARRRALRVLAPQAGSSDAARDQIASALDDADPEVRDAAFELLVEGDPQARAALLPHIAEASPRGDAAARALARAAPREAIGPMLAALSAAGGSERPKLREALALACEAADAEVLAAIRTWNASSATTTAARASLALGLSRLTRADAIDRIAGELVESAVESALSFEDRYRLVEAAAALPAAPASDQWLARMAREDERWMVRAAALSGLSAHGSPDAAQVARTALADPYPRVRMAAALALAKAPGSLEVLAKHAARDRWPMVRAAALDALADQSGAEGVLERGLSDASRLPRAAAVRALTKRRARAAWPAIKATLENRDEWPEVLLEGIAYARTMCQADAGKVLLALLRRGLKPDAWTRDADVATLALEALLELGGQPAKDALLLARSPSAPVGFRAAAERLAAQSPRCASSKAVGRPAAR